MKILVQFHLYNALNNKWVFIG